MSESLVVSFICVWRAKLASEISHSLQSVSMGSRLTLILVGAAILLSVALLTWVFLRSKSQPKRRWIPDSDADWDHFPRLQPNAMLPALLNMFMNQMTQSQQDQHQQEVEQFWMIQESTNDLPTFSDSTWDL